MKVNFSLCCPIHNEAKHLPYVIPSWLKLTPRPSEFILVFDRCSDRSEEISQKYLEKLKHKFIVKEDSNPDWNCQIAHNRQLAFNSANFNIILNTDADTILDPRTAECLSLVGTRFDVIGFRRMDYPLDHHFITTLFPHYFSPLYAIWKPSWKKVGFNKKVFCDEDNTLIAQLREHGFKYHYVSRTRSIHLRKAGGFSSQEFVFIRGGYRWKFQHSPVWKVVLSTLIHTKPTLLLGYLYAMGEKKEKRSNHNHRKR